MKIKSKLLIALVSITIIPIVVISVLNFVVAKDTIEMQIKEHLSSVAEGKADWISDHLSERKGDMFILSEMPIVLKSTIEESKNIPFLEEYKEVYEYYDIFLISTEGDIFYTVEHESDYDTNLLTGPYSDTNLAKVFKEAKSLKHREVAVSNFEFYEPSNKSAAFFAVPIYADPYGKRKPLLGVVVAQISTDEINDILLERAGLGTTGETLMAQRNENGDADFFTARRFGDDEKALPIIPKERLEVPMTQALLGNNDVFSEVVDYRDIKVIAATRYIQETDWGLVAKMDEAEAFTLIKSLSSFELIVVFTMLLFAVLLGIILANHFSKPISKLSEAATEISKGNYNIVTEGEARKDEIGELAKVLNETALSLKLKEREKYDFITSASHQIRTPASGVKIALQLLKEGISKIQVAKEISDTLEDIIENNARVIAITNDLFKLLELGDNYIPSKVSGINLKEIVNQVVQSFEEDIAKKMIKVDTDIPSNLIIQGQEGPIKDVFLNLIDNAVNYSSDGGKITIRAKIKDDKAFIEVSDTGIGIPKKEQIHLFEKFFRAKNSYLKSSVGTGLGLTIVKTIVVGHGGEIRFSSEENKGTSFMLTLPAQISEQTKNK